MSAIDDTVPPDPTPALNPNPTSFRPGMYRYQAGNQAPREVRLTPEQVSSVYGDYLRSIRVFSSRGWFVFLS